MCGKYYDAVLLSSKCTGNVLFHIKLLEFQTPSKPGFPINIKRFCYGVMPSKNTNGVMKNNLDTWSKVKVTSRF